MSWHVVLGIVLILVLIAVLWLPAIDRNKDGR